MDYKFRREPGAFVSCGRLCSVVLYQVNDDTKRKCLSLKFCKILFFQNFTMKIAVTPRTLEFLIRQGNGVLDIVAPEVFYQIMMFLQPKDLRVCMCVSKKWKVRRKCVCTCLSSALSHFVEDMNTRQRLSFSFPELRYSL